MMYLSVGCLCQGVGSEGAAGVTPVREVQGLPCPGHSQIHNGCARGRQHWWHSWENRQHCWENTVKEGEKTLDREKRDQK